MRTCAFFTLLSVCLLFNNNILSGQNSWQPLAGPNGIAIQATAAADDGKAYIATTYDGVFRTIDNGATWQSFNGGLLNQGYTSNASIATAPGGKAYYCDSQDLYRLASNGNSWEQLSLPNNDYADLIFTNTLGDLFAVETFGGIYRSTNGGSSFSLFVPDAAMEGWPGIYAFHGNGHNFASVAYGTSARIYKISDDGVQVNQIAAFSDVVNSLVYHEVSGRILYTDGSIRFSDNDGASWQTATIVPGASSQPSIRLLIEQPSGDLIATSYDINYISQDNGDTWSPLTGPLGDLRGEIKMAFNSSNSYAATPNCGDQVFISTSDNWASWEDQGGKFSSPSVSGIFKDPAGNLYAKTCNHLGFDRSTDNGATWQPILLPNGSNVAQISKNSFGYLFASALDSLYRSTNAGATWQNITPNNSSIYSGQVIFGPQNELIFYSQIDSYKSTNNGDTWEAVSFPQFIYSSAAAFHPDGSFFVGGNFSGIWRSTDGLQTWEQMVSADADIYSLHITSKGDIFFYMDDFINGNSGFFVSHDNLDTYQLLDANLYPSSIVSDIEGDIYICDYQGVLFSEDDGVTWQGMNSGLPNSKYVNTLYIDDDQYLYAGISGDVIYKSALPVSEKNTLRGKIYFDENENCQFDQGEQPLQGWKIKAMGGGSDFYKSAGFDGSFVMGLPLGDFHINPVLPNALWENSCNPQGSDISFTASGDTIFVDYPIAPATLCPILDVDISTPLLRRCFDNTYTVKVCNDGTVAADATVEVTLDSFLIFQSANIPIVSQIGNVYTFSVDDVGVNDCKSFQILVKVSCDASLGQTHCVEANIDQAPCSTFPVARKMECQPNIGSFDPNEKNAFVSGHLEDEWVSSNTDIEYHIRFQNTGTDTAFTIVVEDQLSSWLDPSTLRLGSSSHPYSFEMSETGKLRFIFSNIMLPDSNINEMASHGFVKFSISQRTDVPHGNFINNSASIFFDFNEPIITNTVKLHVGSPSATFDKNQHYSVLAYPNPFGDATHLKINGLDGQKLQLRLFDARGILVKQESFIAPEVMMKRGGLTSGLYFFSLEKSGEIVGRGKLIVE